MNKTTNFNFWWRWLIAADMGVILFGVMLVLFPALARQGFSLMVFSDPAAIDGFPQQAVKYITLSHAVMGAVMIGWGVSMLYTLFTQFRAGAWTGWVNITTALTLWFIPDTAASLATGFWQNAVLNTVFILLFAIPLAGTYLTIRSK